MEETILKLGALHLDEIGKLEHTLEGARRDALIQDFAGILR